MKKLKIMLLILCVSSFLHANSELDYSKKENWLMIESDGKKECDVFFVHPTTYMELKEVKNAKLDDEQTNALSFQVVKRLSGVFEKTCNIFAPKYRQASVSVLSLPIEKRKVYLDFGRKDVQNAWQYYKKHLNNNKPYFIAGHSQGSNVIKDMLVQNPNLISKKHLIGVYAIGYTITQQDLDKMGLKLAITPTQNAGVITYNTIGKGGKSIVIEKGALCVNPLSWTNETKEQNSSKNLFALIDKEKIPHFTSAKIDKNGALVIPTPSIVDKLMMPMGKEVYHMYDYEFFYGNLIENIQTRFNTWKEKMKQNPKKTGELLSSKFVASISKDKINTYFPERKNMNGSIDDIPKYGIDLYSITYSSSQQGKIVELSGLIVVPKKQGKHTLLQYHHGTLYPYPSKDGWGSLDVPSLYKGEYPKTHKASYETRLVGNYLGSYGFLVSLPDYAGYGVSAKLEHPYSINSLLATQSVDMIKATKEFAKQKNLLLDDGVFLTGWSEGGAVSVATQKLIEKNHKNSIKIVANAPLSGFLNIADNFTLSLSQMPSIDANLGENLDFLAWAYYAYNKFSSNALSFDKMFKIQVKNQLDVLKNRSSSVPSKIFKPLDKKTAQFLALQAQKSNLSRDWKPKAPLFIHHGTADMTVPFNNNAEVSFKNFQEQGVDVKLIKYEGHGHESLGLLYLKNIIKEFESIKNK
ncbi:MAG: DUF3089 domain-containing protein [Campylobacteraceae bacterium]|nr:DUF3089 domain-containing protein [Campylobacteraceae bacterium]